MPDLETLLREVRPAPRPEWASRMDARVAARFPGPVPVHRKALRGLRTHFAAFALATASLATVLLIVVVAVKVQNGTGSEDAGSSSSASSVAAAPEVSKAAPDAPALRQPEPLSNDRAVLKNATLTLTASPG